MAVAHDVHMIGRDLDRVRSVVAHDLPGLALREPGRDIRIVLIVVGRSLVGRRGKEKAGQEQPPEKPEDRKPSSCLLRITSYNVCYTKLLR